MLFHSELTLPVPVLLFFRLAGVPCMPIPGPSFPLSLPAVNLAAVNLLFFRLQLIKPVAVVYPVLFVYEACRPLSKSDEAARVSARRELLFVSGTRGGAPS
jgi:hypothetical protein